MRKEIRDRLNGIKKKYKLANPYCGTNNNYTYWKCRCPACTLAHREYTKRNRETRKVLQNAKMEKSKA